MRRLVREFVERVFGCLARLRPRRAKQAHRYHPVAVHAAIVGAGHLAEQQVGQDVSGAVAVDGVPAWAWFVVDGAGGESNALRAAQAVAKAVSETARNGLAGWTDAVSLQNGLRSVFECAHQAARRVCGKAAMVFFVYVESGLWGVLQTGDAIFVRRDFRKVWHLPILPFKGYLDRTGTTLLGDKNAECNIETGHGGIDVFLLTSDWACGKSGTSPIRDTTPDQPVFGTYTANRAPLDALAELFLPNGVPATEQQAAERLIAIRDGRFPSVAYSPDDMSIVAGKMREEAS